MIKLAPSILAANFANLEKDIKELEQMKVPYLHLDVMDGNFVPNISFGIPLIKSIREVTGMFFDVHLMIEKPERYLKDFFDAGANNITIHYEATENAKNVLCEIKKLGINASVSIKPTTPADVLFPFLDIADMVLIMSVEPGFGGQKLIESTLSKARELREFIDRNNLKTDIEMDGGIGLDNVRSVLNAGVNVVVVGSQIFNAGNIRDSVEKFYKAFSEAGVE